MSIKVKYNGKLYPSVVMAAEEIGCAPARLYRAVRDQGADLDEAGYTLKTVVGGNKCQVVYDGIEYPSIKDAAKAIGCNSTHLGRVVSIRGTDLDAADYRYGLDGRGLWRRNNGKRS